VSNKQTVFLDPPLWQMFQAKVLTQAQAIRLQSLSDRLKQGQAPLKLSRRDQDLMAKFQLFHAPVPPIKH
jgi:hypothetical protein